eukprot:706337-Amphidinium_carterae.1
MPWAWQSAPPHAPVRPKVAEKKKITVMIIGRTVLKHLLFSYIGLALKGDSQMGGCCAFFAVSYTHLRAHETEADL